MSKPLTPIVFTIATTCAWVSLNACSDDDGPARPRYVITVGDTSISGPVSTLSDPELGEVCGSYNAYVDAEINFEAVAYVACLPPSIVLGLGEPQRCRELLDECMQGFPEPIEVEAQAADDVCIAGLRSCNASIEDLEGCVNVNLGFIFDVLDNWTCGNVDDDRMAEAARAMDTLTLCTDVDAGCGLGNLPNSLQ